MPGLFVVDQLVDRAGRADVVVRHARRVERSHGRERLLGWARGVAVQHDQGNLRAAAGAVGGGRGAGRAVVAKYGTARAPGRALPRAPAAFWLPWQLAREHRRRGRKQLAKSGAHPTSLGLDCRACRWRRPGWRTARPRRPHGTSRTAARPGSRCARSVEGPVGVVGRAQRA